MMIEPIHIFRQIRKRYFTIFHNVKLLILDEKDFGNGLAYSDHRKEIIAVNKQRFNEIKHEKSIARLFLHEFTHFETIQKNPDSLEHGREFIHNYRNNLFNHFGGDISWVFEREVWHNEWDKTEKASEIIKRLDKL